MPIERKIRLGDHIVHDDLSCTSVVLDIGAHVGTFSRLVLDRYGCIVVAFEPNPVSFLELTKLHQVYPKLICYNYAVHPENKETKYTDYGNKGYSGSLYKRGGEYKAGRRDYVNVIPFERTLGDRDKIDLVKMDIEGSEIAVLLESPADALLKCRQITVEFHVGAHKGFSPPFTQADVDRCVKRMTSMDFIAEKTNSRNPDYLFFRP